VAALAAAAALMLVIGAIQVPDLEQWVSELSRSLGQWTYLVVGVFAFLETAAFVGLAIPGETAVLAGGMVAHQGDVELVPLILVVWLAATAGDVASFTIGRRLGRPFLASRGARLGLDAPRLARIDRFYVRHGEVAVIAGRFVGVARAVMPFLAGTSRMRARRFIACSVSGALAWAALLTSAGYAFAGSAGAADDAVTRVALGGALVVAVVMLHRRRARSANRAGRGHGEGRRARGGGSRGQRIRWRVDLEDLDTMRAAGSVDVDDISAASPEDRFSDR
jgi:membrane protein DedA with SNARE-associated domain